MRFEPTPQEIVGEVLKTASLSERDTIFDLGSGDGRILIAAAKNYGARGVGVEIDPELVATAQGRARAAGVADKVRFVQEDLFNADIRPATVITLFLLPEANLMLRPKLLRELDPGTRIVSYSHDMRDWKPERIRHVMDHLGWYHRILLWTVPLAQGPALPSD